MKAVIQRSKQASVKVGEEVVAAIPFGYVVLLGVEAGDSQEDLDFIVEKISRLRLWPGGGTEKKEFDRDIAEVGGEILLVSQFTLLGQCRKGRRPDWGRAAPAELAEPLYRQAAKKLRLAGLVVKEGRFAASMEVGITNAGPVTMILDSRDRSRPPS